MMLSLWSRLFSETNTTNTRDMTLDIDIDAFDDPECDYAVINLGVDWMVRAYVKESRYQDNLQGSWIRVGDIPAILTQVYSLRLCPGVGGADAEDILSCEEVAGGEGAYLLAPLPAEGEAPFAAAATEGEWLKPGWNPACRSLWLGDDVHLRVVGNEAFHSVKEIVAPCGMVYRKESRICSYLSAGHRRWVRPAGQEQPVVQVEAPRMMRLVLSGYRWEEFAPPCVIRLAHTFSMFNVRKTNQYSFSLDVYGRRISGEKAFQFPRAECYADIAASYCENM